MELKHYQGWQNIDIGCNLRLHSMVIFLNIVVVAVVILNYVLCNVNTDWSTFSLLLKDSRRSGWTAGPMFNNLFTSLIHYLLCSRAQTLIICMNIGLLISTPTTVTCPPLLSLNSLACLLWHLLLTLQLNHALQNGPLWTFCQGIPDRDPGSFPKQWWFKLPHDNQCEW